MSKIEFSVDLPATQEKLLEIATDYERFGEVQPLVKSIKILEKNDNEIITEEIIKIRGHEIQFSSSHKKIDQNTIETTVLSGPFTGTNIKTTFEKIDSGTKISVLADLKISSLKYKFIGPLIKKKYKMGLLAMCYRMNSIALSS